MSDFPARILSGQLPKDEPDAAGKYSRIFLPDPAQFRFDWSRATPEGELEGLRVG
jgi:hypothetical protein